MHIQGVKCNVIDYCLKHPLFLSFFTKYNRFASRISFQSSILLYIFKVGLLYFLRAQILIQSIRCLNLIILLSKMHNPRLGEDYFKDAPSQLPQDILKSLCALLANYHPLSFQSFLRDRLKEIKNGAALGWILTKLTNEEKVREFASHNYQFLLFGKMEDRLRKHLLDPKMEDLRFQLLYLVQLIGKEELPEYLILKNYFAETPSLTFNTLLSSFKDTVMRDKVQVQMKDMKDFSPLNILNKEQLKKILDFIIPINIAGLQFFVQQYLRQQNFAQEINDDVILFKGVTGCGKSTMILYLLGYKIILQKDFQGLWQTMPEGLVHEQHIQIVSKSSNASVTNTCHLVKLLNSAEPKPVYFMDSPGQEDSRSINRIILNYLIMKKTYSHYPRIKFVEVINTAKLSQQKINGLKKFSKYIADSYNFDSLDDLRDILTVLFNKCSCNYDTIREVLKSIQQCLFEPLYKDWFTAKQKIALRFLLDTQNENEEYEDCPVAIPMDFHQKQEKREILLRHLIEKKTCQNPSQIAKNVLKDQYMDKIHSTLQYLASNIRQWLNDRKYDMVNYYYKQFSFLSSHFSGHSLIIGILSQQVPNIIKEHFQKQLEALKHLVRLNCSTLYIDDDFNTIKDHYYSIKQVAMVKDQSWFSYVTFIGQLNTIKQQLLSSYQLALKQGSAHPQLVDNYKKFAQIFQQQINLLLPMLSTKTHLEEQIISILQSQNNYNEIDELYTKLREVRQNIFSFNPSQPLQNKVEAAFNDLILYKYAALHRGIEQQIKKVSSLSLFQTMPTGPNELSNILQDYQMLNYSKVLQELKAQKNQMVQLQRLAQRLISKIQQFGESENFSFEIVDNFKTFITNYSQLAILKQAMLPHLVNLAQTFTAKRNRVIQEYSELIQKCKRSLIEPHDDIDAQANNMQAQIKRCRIYSYYLGEAFDEGKLQLNLIQFIQQLDSQYSSCSISIGKIRQEIQKFSLLVKRRDKIKVIQSYLPHLQQFFKQYDQSCRSFVLNFINCIQMAIQENIRLAKFVTQIKQKQLSSYFEVIQQIWPAIQQLEYSQDCQELIVKAYSEVFDNCNYLADSEVAYEPACRMYEQDDVEKQVYIADLIYLFKFLSQLPENQYFTNRYKEIDLKDKIVKKLSKELKHIRSEILQNHKKMTRQFYECVKCKIYFFQNLESIVLKDGAIKEQLKQILTKLKEVNHLADQHNPNTHEQPRFEVTQSHGLAFNFHIFKKFYDSALHKRQTKELALNTFEHYLCRFIEKIEDKNLNNTQQYDTLKVIKHFLQSKQKKISSLNNVLTKIEDNFVATITDSYRNAENMQLAGDYKKSIAELKKIQQLKIKCQQKEMQIRQKIKELQSKLTGKLNDMESFQRSLQSNTSINVYENYDQIIHLLQTSHNHSSQQRIEALLFNEIDYLKKIRIDNPDFDSFKDKSIKISNLISMLNGHNKQVLSNQLDTIKDNLNAFLTASINDALSYKDNYGELMKLMFKQSILGSDKLTDRRKILFIKIQQQLNNNDHLRVQEMFRVLERNFWVKNIAENVLQTYKAINEQREKIFMESIEVRSIKKEVQNIQKTIDNPKAKPVIRQENIQRYSSVMFFQELKKHNHLFYSKNLYQLTQQKYCEKLKKIRSRLQANSQERGRKEQITRNCTILGKIIDAISVPASEQHHQSRHQNAALQ